MPRDRRALPRRSYRARRPQCRGAPPRYRVRQLLAENLGRVAALPLGVSPPRLLPLTAPGATVLQIGFTSDKLDAMNGRLDLLRDKLDEVGRSANKRSDDAGDKFSASCTNITTHLESVRKEISTDMSVMRTDMFQRFDTMRDELFAALAGHSKGAAGLVLRFRHPS